MASKFSLTQRAIASKTNLSRTKQLPFEAKEKLAPIEIEQLNLEDVEIPTEEKLSPPNNLYITLKLPKEVAILHIYQNGADEYVVWGGNTLIPLLQTQSYEVPNLSLGNLVKQGELPENIQEDMKYFSHVNVEIRRWLKSLIRKFGEQLCLVISDHTNFEIPWEMLELSPYDDSPNEYVGALMTTVRWRQIISADDYLLLDCKPDECRGHALAYILDTELKGVGPEIDALTKLQAVIYRSSQHHIKEFQAHLQQSESSCSFVYISCHASIHSNFREITLGSNLDEQQQLKLLALRKCQLNLVKNSQGIVFINACHSGREQAHNSIPHNYRMGFVELFLAKGARGVVGTLGAVGDTYAAQFAHDLIEESLRPPQASVATILRKLRLKVVKNLPSEPNTRDLLPLIYTFMYVYYGNPMTVLRLIARGEENYVK